MSRSSLFASCLVSLLALGCATPEGPGPEPEPAPEGLQPGDIVPAGQVLPPKELLDYQIDVRLSSIEGAAGGGFSLDRLAWNTARGTALRSFQEPLGVDLQGPLSALLAILEVDFTVQADGSLVAEKVIDINGQPVAVKVVALLAADGAISAQLFLNDVQRLDLSADAGLSNVSAAVFDAAGAEVLSVVFTRNGQDFSVVFTRAADGDVFTLSLAAGVLTVERAKNGDGFGNDGGEFQLVVDTNNFAGQFTLVVLGIPATVCFGGGQLVSVGCN
jgi:hypothetical protein